MLTDPATGLHPAGRAQLSAGRRRVLLAGLLVLLLAIGTLLVVQRLRPKPPVPLKPLPPAAQVVDRALRNCVVAPSKCGYPDASNTGVPASVDRGSTGDPVGRKTRLAAISAQEMVSSRGAPAAGGRSRRR